MKKQPKLIRQNNLFSFFKTIISWPMAIMFIIIFIWWHWPDIYQWANRWQKAKIGDFEFSVSTLEDHQGIENIKDQFEEIRAAGFKNEDVRVDFKRFVNCNFENVRFLYAGKSPLAFSYCKFKPLIKWRFEGYAEVVLNSFSAMYLGFGPYGEQIVDETFKKIKDGRILNPIDKVSPPLKKPFSK